MNPYDKTPVTRIYRRSAPELLPVASIAAANDDFEDELPTENIDFEQTVVLIRQANAPAVSQVRTALPRPLRHKATPPPLPLAVRRLANRTTNRLTLVR